MNDGALRAQQVKLGRMYRLFYQKADGVDL